MNDGADKRLRGGDNGERSSTGCLGCVVSLRYQLADWMWLEGMVCGWVNLQYATRVVS